MGCQVIMAVITAISVYLIVFLSPKIIVSCQVTQYPQQVLYVKKNNASQCPRDIRITKCHTFDWFADHIDSSFVSNTKLLFEEGKHTLKKVIVVENCHNFTMAGNGRAEHSKDGIPQPTATIFCDNGSTAGFYFSNSSNIKITNIELKFCTGRMRVEQGKHHYNIISASLILYSIQNVSLEQIFISGSKGHALYAEDLFDSIHVADSAFLYSSKNQNFSESGNARLEFLKPQPSFTSLVLESSWFMYGETSLHHSDAGGLIISIYCPNVHVSIVNVTARGNTGGLGGNIAIFLEIFEHSCSSIAINKCHILDGTSTKGGGLAFWSKQSQKYFDKEYVHHLPVDQNILTISNTIFYNNFASKSSGAVYIAHYSHATMISYLKQITLTNCTFIDNGGRGSSVDILQHSLQPMTPFLNTSLVKCNFTNNRLDDNNGAIVAIYSDKVSLIDCTFTGSHSTAISLSSAYLSLHGNILFENNTARLGGAMKINEASLVFIHNGTHVRFVNNRAEVKGGAIYVKTSCVDSFKSTAVCFLQPVPPLNDHTPISNFTKFMKLEFVNNSATVSGDALYGGDIDRCSTTLPYTLNQAEEHKYYSHFPEIFHRVFEMTQQHKSSSVSSDPRKVCFCKKFSHKSCATMKDPIKVFPGQKFTVAVMTLGQQNSSTRGRVSASLVDESYPNHRLSRINYSELSDECIDVSYVLKSNMSRALISFAPETAGIYCNITSANLIVHLLQCPLGFKLTETASFMCSCDPFLSKFLPFNQQVTCSINNQTISIPQKSIWFGCLDSEQHNQSFASTCDSLVVAPNCDHYCRNAEENSTTVEIHLNDLDKQCSDGHTGIMCGQCQAGYSRVLGESMTCHRGCTYSNLPIIMIAFLSSGIMLLIIIRALNLTVTEGTINGLLVYTMVIQTHQSYFSENLSSFGKVCWVFISWVNLNLGISACFYRGMDGYEQIWTHFGQAVFSFLFLLMVVLLGRRFILFTRLLGRNIVKVLATLVAMIYSNLLYATLITLQPAVLHISAANGTQYSRTVWYYDGAMPYFGVKHTPLFVMALICSLFILYLIFSLLFIQCLQRRSELPCLHWVERLRPFYEAYTGPCRDHYRFWPGFLLFVRTGLFVMNSLIPSHIDVFFRMKMLITAVTFVLVISLACISPKGVYKKWPLNILELSFYLNLCLTSGFLGLTRNYNKNKNSRVVYSSVSIAALTFVGILVYHSYTRINSTKVWKMISNWTSVRDKFVRNRHPRPAVDSDQDEECNERDQLLPQTLPPAIRFDHLREPLVET